MRKAFALFIVLLFVLSVGCASQPAQEVQDVPESDVTAPAAEPKATAPAEPAKVEAPQAEETAAPAANDDAEKTDAPTSIGTRVGDTQVEAKEEFVPEGESTIKLYANKTMSSSSMTISAGTTLFWKSFDTWPHVLNVEQGKGLDTKRLAQSERLLEGGVWQYTFNDKGVFLVRDTFAGAMRMNVTVE
ncbi:hypothetical protein KY363_01000 [Candidatus Woesearchaeota archaeon]|nr:hypothetical protein [Candidatus Woesearchaeota archaeon]